MYFRQTRTRILMILLAIFLLRRGARLARFLWRFVFRIEETQDYLQIYPKDNAEDMIETELQKLSEQVKDVAEEEKEEEQESEASETSETSETRDSSSDIVSEEFSRTKIVFAETMKNLALIDQVALDALFDLTETVVCSKVSVSPLFLSI